MVSFFCLAQRTIMFMLYFYCYQRLLRFVVVSRPCRVPLCIGYLQHLKIHLKRLKGGQVYKPTTGPCFPYGPAPPSERPLDRHDRSLLGTPPNPEDVNLHSSRRFEHNPAKPRHLGVSLGVLLVLLEFFLVRTRPL